MIKVLLWSGGYDSTVLKAHLGEDVKTFFADITYYNPDSTYEYSDNYSESLKVGRKMDYHIFLSLDRAKDTDYMPGRNTILVMSCINNLIWQGVDSAEIYIGLIKNFPRYADATQEWVDSINKVLEVEFGGKFKVIAPFIDLTKDDVFKLGCSLGVKLEDTFSCNFEDDDGVPCGKCDNCLWREKHKYPSYWRVK